MSDIFNLFLNYNPDFLEKLKLFPEALKKAIIIELNNATSETKFLSLVSEINFGLLFNGLGFNLQYERILFDNKKPDWEISIENTKAICEVYRLGQSFKDQLITNFENELKRGFERIKFGYQIKYDFKEPFLNVHGLEADNIISKLNIWFSNGRIIGDAITIDDKINFKIIASNQNNKLTYLSGSKSIDYKIDKLVQKEYMRRPNEISLKLSEYTSIIRKLRIPYFICIESDFKNGLNFDEFVNYFQGSWCVYTEDDILTCCENDIEYSELGCLYDYNTVSGIIIKIGNDFRKILNPLKNQLIYNRVNFPIFKRLNLIKNASV